MSTSGLPIISVEDSTKSDAILPSETLQSSSQSGSPGQVEESILQPGALLYEPPPPLEGTLVRIQSIGWGGYSEVYRGIWTHGGKDVSVGIKCLRPRNPHEEDPVAQQHFERRIRRETIIWQRAQHDNILPFTGYQIADGVAMLVSPWCENGNLKTHVSRHPEMTVCAKLELLRDAARGLAHLHSLQPPIVHGDIKPDNVIITAVKSQIRAALVDFGISRLMVGLGMRTGLTTAGGAGTAGYQARELILDDKARPTDKSDVYSFGGLILATMTGRSPFHQINTDASIVLAVFQGKVPEPSDHPQLHPTDSLWGLMRCWNSNPSQRPSMGEVIDEVEDEIQRRSTPGVGSG